MTFKENNFWLEALTEEQIITFTCEYLGDFLSLTFSTDPYTKKQLVDIVYEDVNENPVHEYFDAYGFNKNRNFSDYEKYALIMWRKYIAYSNKGKTFNNKTYEQSIESIRMQVEMNNFWLSNLNEKAIADYANRHHYEFFWSCLRTDFRTDKNFIEIMCENQWGYPDESYRDAYGYPVINTINDSIKDWFYVMRTANEGKTFNGITYTQAFKQHHGLSVEESLNF